MASSSFNENNWSHYAEITSDNTQVDEAVGDISFDLSLLDSTWWNNVEKSNGGDVRAVNSAGDTAYSFELENFDINNQTGVIFFDSQNLVTGSDTTWRIYVGNSNASLPADSDTLGAHNVWKTAYGGRYGLEEDPSGTAPQIKDSTANNNDGTSKGSMTSGDQVAGKIGGALEFDGSDDEIEFGDVIEFNDTFTLFGWVKFTATSKQGMIDKRRDGGNFEGYYLTPEGGNDAPQAEIRDVNSNQARVTATNSIHDGNWHLLVATFDKSSASGAKLYVDGSEVTYNTQQDPTNVGDITNNANNQLATFQQGSAGRLQGTLDEQRYIDTVESVNWISTHYNVQSDQAGFWKVGNTVTTLTPTDNIANIFIGGGSFNSWIKPYSDGENNQGNIVFKHWSLSTTDESNGLVKIRFEYPFDTTNGIWKTTSRVVNVDEWSMVTVNFNADSDNNDPTIFIDETSVSVDEIQAPSGSREDDTVNDLFFGNNSNQTRGYDGKMDECRLYDAKLTQSEVSEIFATKKREGRLDVSFKLE